MFASLSARLRRLWREPLVHFVVLGASLFVAHGILGGENAAQGSRAIVITDRFVESLEAHHARRTGTAPDETTRQALVDQFVRTEALYREAKRLGLDRGDPIVRQRLVQKMEFFLEGTAPVPEPGEGDLRAHLAAHADRYRRAPRVGFRHVFFSRDRRGAAAEADAQRALEVLRATADIGAPEGLGDPFLLGLEVSPRALDRLAGTFGQSFASALGELRAEDAWSGPLASAHGFHVVHVTERVPGGIPSLDDVRQRVRAEWIEARRRDAVHRATQDLVGTFAIERVEDPSAPTLASGSTP